MIETERQQLKRYISILKDWHGNMLPDHVLVVFDGLEELNQDKNPDLWAELDRVILENDEFNWKPFLDYIEPHKGNQQWWKSIFTHLENSD